MLQFCAFLVLSLFVLSANGVPINNTNSTKKCADMLHYSEETGFCYGYPGGAGGTLWQAEQWCNSLGGHVPSIHSDAEFQFLRNLSQNFGHEFFIGLYREGLKRQWTDGTPNDYTVQLHADTTCWFQKECCYIMVPNGVYSRHCNNGSTRVQCKFPALS